MQALVIPTVSRTLARKIDSKIELPSLSFPNGQAVISKAVKHLTVISNAATRKCQKMGLAQPISIGFYNS